MQKPTVRVVGPPQLEGAKRHPRVDRACPVGGADDARLAAGAGARVAGPPGVDERHPRAAPPELERGPPAERAGADDDDPWLI